MRETGRVLITAPTELPVSRAEIKDHLRANVDDTAQDDLIDGLIASAVDEAESYTWRRFCTQTWDIYFDGFPPGGECFEVPLPPLQSVTSITYVDTDGVSTVLSSALYQVDTSAEPAVIRSAYNETWPVTRDQTLQVVKVRCVVGYTTVAKIPKTIIQAIKIIAGRLYGPVTEDVVVGTITATVPFAAQHLLDRHSVRRMVA